MLNWNTLLLFLTSPVAIPSLAALFLTIISPCFSKFIEDGVRKHIPEDIRGREDDIIDFSNDAVQKVSFINSIFIASVHSILVIRTWFVGIPVIFLSLDLLIFLLLPRLSPFIFKNYRCGIRISTWFLIATVAINLFLMFIVFENFAKTIANPAVGKP